MSNDLRLRELLVGIEGLALLRHLYDGDYEESGARLTEIRRLLDDPRLMAEGIAEEIDPRAGYGAWADTYDEPGNPIIALEQPAVWSALESIPPGRALDVACGTGRHTRRLIGLGHEVTGIDLSPEMLARAALNVPEARLIEADLRQMPVGDEDFDLVVCALALAHLVDLSAAISELTRVLRVGGRLFVSVLHPFQTYLAGQARFVDGRGWRGFIREHPHSHADYLAAFQAVALRVLTCRELPLTAEFACAQRRAFRHIPDAVAEAYVGLPGVLIWELEKTPVETAGLR